MDPVTIAIDGPAGSGKSTVSREVALALSGGYLDTGAMYRAAAWSCMKAGIDLTDEKAVTEHVGEMPLQIITDPSDPRVLVGEDDITDAIRTEEVSTRVSAVATNPQVRIILQERQRALLFSTAHRLGFCVAEGRDITTVVAPEADVRVLLTASEEARMARRSQQLQLEDNEETAERMRDQVLRRDRDDSTVSEFMTAADGVTTIDTTRLSIDDVVNAVLELVPGIELVDDDDDWEDDDWAEDGVDADDVQRTQALRAGLDDYDLDDEDAALLSGEFEDFPTEQEQRLLPTLAIVGRPNVGKSTFVNRILGHRAAVVEDTPGVTRDRVFYEANWAGRDFMLVDTGGWEDRVAGIDHRVAEQAEAAIGLADAVVFIVDVHVGITTTDEQFVKVLRRSKKPVLLVANKVDDERAELEAASLWNLGLGEPHMVSALHGRGSGDVLDAVLEVLPEEGSTPAKPDGPRRVALIGRPNVGKSSLLNKLAKENRVVVDNVPGTTRDPVDEVITLAGREWTFVDTAGIRRRVNQTGGADFFASIRTQAALDRAEVAVVLLEATETISTQDMKIIDMVLESGRALVLAFNKWDLIDEDRRKELEWEIEKDLAHVAWAPRINISAETGRHTDKLVPALDRALESWDARIPTARLNAFLGTLVAAHPHPLRGGKQPRILFATQARSRPPRFVIFASGFLEHGYRRFIERRLREDFEFTGSPIEISVRIREKRKRR
ncbi:bifunctional cytidylate kinase/GTPase Der [Helcobacillus massiliensis]|uniref:bifunctional cytidylate kinase/GTPase Der n=1 Tax=Helcobacillus massiliensis TaxID=521392 RepID=UPI0021A65CE6|nr:bifunctional cytidylate kinase/GTPase Der [Helcobacillus massiliensis]MCT1557022.1 bifunctional cytidylate kinase/GTPase Der [Helcobacillus massiliensis]MCT2035411.1 bifunctional cytidylate kinase/GTPase Der [Helcobacillus massiliensis]MCT2331374.1 bifunctional cytidylate kinase/GTPase Der [Helcobacillus massiliensis]